MSEEEKKVKTLDDYAGLNVSMLINPEFDYDITQEEFYNKFLKYIPLTPPWDDGNNP